MADLLQPHLAPGMASRQCGGILHSATDRTNAVKQSTAMRSMTFQESLQYLSRYINYEQKSNIPYGSGTYDLASFSRLLRQIGNPQSVCNAIHIAGTKGKGSTAAILHALLRAARCSVGLFTSPHLIDIRERIRYNGMRIPEQEFAHCIAVLADVLERNGTDLPARRYRTYFELLTAAAFLYFKRKNPTYSIFEVGMGGRLDCTNVIQPVVTAITTLGLDHTRSLGSTLVAIAKEKAGIIKQGIPVVIAPGPAETVVAIKEISRQTGALCHEIARDSSWEILEQSPYGSRIRFNIDGCECTSWLSLAGSHQAINATLALRIFKALHDRNEIPWSETTIHQGLQRVRWPGRLQVITRGDSTHSWLITDGAHNADAAQVLRSALDEIFPGKALVFIIGISKDKDVENFCRMLLPGSQAVICTRFGNPRALAPDRLADHARNFARNVDAAPDLEQALSRVRNRNDNQVVVCVTGSIYLAGEMLAHARR